MPLKKRFLTLADFTHTQNLISPVEMSPVLTYTVPTKFVTFVDPTLPLFGSVYAKFSTVLQSGNISSRTVTVTLPYRVSIPPSSYRTLPVYCVLKPGASQEVVEGTVVDADGARVTVRATFTGTPAANDAYDVYFPIDNAQFDLAVITPAGTAQSVVKLINGVTGMINMINPFDKRQSDKLIVTRIVPALEDYIIAFRVKASVPIVFNSPIVGDKAVFELPIVEGDVETFAKLSRQFPNIAAFKEQIRLMITNLK